MAGREGMKHWDEEWSRCDQMIFVNNACAVILGILFIAAFIAILLWLGSA